MRRRLTPFVQVAFGFLAASLLCPPALMAQHVGTNLPSPIGLRPSPSLPVPSRGSGLPSGPMHLPPGVRFPSAPIHEGPPRPPVGPSHRPDNGQHGAGYRTYPPYIYAGYPWLNSFGYGLPVPYGGLPYDGGQDQSQPAPQQAGYSAPPAADPAPEPPAPEVAVSDAPTFRPAYLGHGESAPVSAQPATTLIFKDGRQPIQVHNYALTANTLYALDGDTRQEIPLSVLDVQATVEANRAAGVDFALPTSR